MKKAWIIAIILLVFTTVSTVSASGPIHFSYTGDLVVTYISGTAGYNDEFGIETSQPVSLGFTQGNLTAVPGATLQIPRSLFTRMNRLSCIVKVPPKEAQSRIIPIRPAGTGLTTRS